MQVTVANVLLLIALQTLKRSTTARTIPSDPISSHLIINKTPTSSISGKDSGKSSGSGGSGGSRGTSGTNNDRNRWNTPGGTNNSSGTSYHYSNKDGSYYYANDNGSKCTYLLLSRSPHLSYPLSCCRLFRYQWTGLLHPAVIQKEMCKKSLLLLSPLIHAKFVQYVLVDELEENHVAEQGC